jgi:hypothetical protein
MCCAYSFNFANFAIAPCHSLGLGDAEIAQLDAVYDYLDY